jgi:hypothetical protein
MVGSEAAKARDTAGKTTRPLSAGASWSHAPSMKPSTEKIRIDFKGDASFVVIKLI